MYDKKDFSEKGRHKLYMVLDTETATLPFANQLAKNSTQKKNIAIAKPLVYDLGYLIVDSDLNVYAERSFLITEIFAVPQVFNTAYYKEKRPIYLERLDKGETVMKSWRDATDILYEDLQKVDYVCAFNAMFDFKKAIPFTEQYIYHLYHNGYQEWENGQRKRCVLIAEGVKFENDRDFDGDNFNFKGIDFPMLDIWGISCKMLINNNAYKKMCLKTKMITESGKFFKSSAESTFRYVCQAQDFDEAHTALDDSIIESFLLHKALKKGKVPKGIEYFPFNMLGTTPDFLLKNTKGIKEEYFDLVIDTMDKKLEMYTKESSFATSLRTYIERLDYEKCERFIF